MARRVLARARAAASITCDAGSGDPRGGQPDRARIHGRIGRIDSTSPSRPEAPKARRLLAELIGTAALVFVAVGGDAMARLAPDQIGSAARAVAPGLMVGALIYAIGDVSGAHLNPAVTAAFTLKRLFPSALVLPYWIAQAAGALGAVIIVRMLFGEAVEAGVSTPHVAAPVAVSLEAILTALLVLVILGTADRARIVGPDAAIAVAAAISLCGLIALPIEGASMNPIRSLAPALIAGRLDDVWIYIAGPFAGAIVAVIAATSLHGLHEDDSNAEEAAQGQGDAGQGS